jgi:hypothetical protein
MPESPRVLVTAAELASNIRFWIAVLGQRRPSILRDLWTRRGEEYDGPRIERARRDLAEHLAEKILYAAELTRAAQCQDAFGAEIIPAHERHRGA